MAITSSNITSLEYIGFVDTDTLFHSYVDYHDIFEDSNKPIIHGRIGQGIHRIIHHFKQFIVITVPLNKFVVYA